MRHREANSNCVRETYETAMKLGIDLDDLSDLNLVRSFAVELRDVEIGKKVKFSSSIHRRLRRLGILNPRSLGLTEHGLQVLEELEAET